MKRPLGIVAVLYAGGVLLGNYFQLPPLYFFVIIPIIFAIPLLLHRLSLFLLLLPVIGWANFTWRAAVTSPFDLRNLLPSEPQLVTVRGTLIGTPEQRVYPTDEGESLRTTARLKVTALQGALASRRSDWQPAFGKIIVTTAGNLPENFFGGQEVQIYGVIGPPPLPLAEGLFDYRAHLRRQEIYFQLKTESSNDWQIVGPPKTSPPFLDRFIKWAKAALAIGRPTIDTPLRLEQALTLADKTYLTDDITEPFMQAATFHIFAVDGLRLAILFTIFFLALRWLRVPRTLSGGVLIPLLWGYVHLTGSPPSAIRAAVMLTIIIASWMLKRPVDFLNSLCAAALIILLWQPQQLFQAGFQLSFCVVFCIFLVMPKFDNFIQRLLRSDPLLPDKLRPQWQITLLKPVRIALDLFFSSLAAWIGSIPLTAYYFHLFTPVSAPANVIAVFLCTWVLVCNSFSLLIAAWLPIGTTVFNFFGWHLMNWIQLTSIWFAHLPGAYRYVAAPGLFSIFAYYALFLAVFSGWLFKPEQRKWKLTALCLLAATWCGQSLYHRSATQLTVLPLNGGSAIYFDAPGNKNDLLIDCGKEDSVQFVMKPYLHAQGVNTLPTVALTVGNAQQVGGFQLLQTIIPAKKIITSSVEFRSPAYRQIIQFLTATPNRRQIANSDSTIGDWTVLHPATTNHFTRADDSAMVLRGGICGTHILLLSQLGRSGQDALLERHPNLRADIVIAGLPDQGEPLTDALLDAIRPALIIISDSKTPAPRRANRALRDRLEKRGLPVVYTSEVGAVKISLEQNHWTAETVGQKWAAPKE